jgi:hypothetical protein
VPDQVDVHASDETELDSPLHANQPASLQGSRQALSII